MRVVVVFSGKICADLVWGSFSRVWLNSGSVPSIWISLCSTGVEFANQVFFEIGKLTSIGPGEDIKTRRWADNIGVVFLIFANASFVVFMKGGRWENPTITFVNKVLPQWPSWIQSNSISVSSKHAYAFFFKGFQFSSDFKYAQCISECLLLAIWIFLLLFS